MPLTIVKRGAVWYVRGAVRGHRVYESCRTETRELAELYRAKRETELFEAAVFGKRAPVSFRDAALSYLGAEPRSKITHLLVQRLIRYFDRRPIAEIRQEACDQAVRALCKPDAEPSTKSRAVITPLSAIVMHAARRDWCEARKFERPPQPRGKTSWLTPREYARLERAAAPHIAPLLRFLVCTGARMSEALELEWTEVDLDAARVIFKVTKNGRPRVAHLPPAAVEVLRMLPDREGRVFRRDDGLPYADHNRESGDQIGTAFRGACKRAGLGEWQLVISDVGPSRRWAHSVTPHDLRHSWATWWYAVHKDILALRIEGGWATVSMVERYAHLARAAIVPDILAVWGMDQKDVRHAATAG